MISVLGTEEVLLFEKPLDGNGNFELKGTGDNLRDIALKIHHKCNSPNVCLRIIVLLLTIGFVLSYYLIWSNKGFLN